MKLTPKQVEIVLMMAEGDKSQEIAVKLFISELTVDNHRKTILKASGCRTWNQFMAEIGLNGQLKAWREKCEVNSKNHLEYPAKPIPRIRNGNKD